MMVAVHLLCRVSLHRKQSLSARQNSVNIGASLLVIYYWSGPGTLLRWVWENEGEKFTPGVEWGGGSVEHGVKTPLAYDVRYQF